MQWVQKCECWKCTKYKHVNVENALGTKHMIVQKCTKYKHVNVETALSTKNEC